MSLVVSWIAVHKRAASCYFVADSRISWEDGSQWDHAQKVFASPLTNEIFAYAGDVIFPTQTLGQLCQLAGIGVLFKSQTPAEERAKIYADVIRSALGSYPPHCLAQPFDILHACCLNGAFTLHRIEYTRDHNVSLSPEEIGLKSGPIKALGSGSTLFEDQYRKEAETSYNVFHAFGKVLDAKIDVKVGGTPQMVSLYSNGRTNVYGLSYFKERALLGLDASMIGCPSAVEWRNENFERWDPRTETLVVGTQRQPRLRV
jgi:hypothetical protein